MDDIADVGPGTAVDNASGHEQANAVDDAQAAYAAVTRLSRARRAQVDVQTTPCASVAAVRSMQVGGAALAERMHVQERYRAAWLLVGDALAA